MKEIVLKKILESHTTWLKGQVGGVRANLRCANLRCANLRDANLCGANLYGANLRGANLYGADLRGTNLCSADLRDANLCGANLYGANLCDANLRRADLRGANLRSADLCGADLRVADLDETEAVRKGTILKRKIIGYKKTFENKIIELEIPIGAIVFSINNNKCRTNKAKVVKCEGVQHSQHDGKFEYVEGKEIEIEDFDLMYNVECSTGVHFFRTREEAEKYLF